MYIWVCYSDEKKVIVLKDSLFVFIIQSYIKYHTNKQITLTNSSFFFSIIKNTVISESHNKSEYNHIYIRYQDFENNTHTNTKFILLK